MLTLDKIKHFASRQGDQAAVVHEGNHLTWNQLQELAQHRLSYLVSRYGEKMPRQACYIVDNRLDIFPWLAAFATLAIPVVGMDYTLPLATLQAMTKKIEVDFVLLSSTLLRRHGAVPEAGEDFHFANITFDLDSPSMAVIDAIGAKETCPADFKPYTAARPFRAVGFTSGTSGIPKAVIRSKSFDQRRFQYFTERYGFGPHDRFMVGMPLYHAAGNGWARLFLSLGATLYLADSGDTATMARNIDRYAITATVLSPVLMAHILNHRKQQGLGQPKTLRWVLVGGRNFTAVEKGRALAVLGQVVYEYYGTTESGVNTIAEPDDLASHPRSVGRAYDGNEIAIISSDGAALSPGRVGTVGVASYMNMDDYLEGGAGFALLDGQRYFLTPDQGYVDEEGRLFLLNRSGVNGTPAHLYELENRIRALPCIDDVAMVLQESPQGAQAQCIYSVKTGGNAASVQERIEQAAVTSAVLLSLCLEVPHIPYSPSGKVRVADLQKLAETAA